MKISITNNQSGLGLLEISLGIFLSSMLFLLLIQFYLAVHATYRLQNAFAELERNTIFLSQWFLQRIHQENLLSCVKSQIIADRIHGYGIGTLPFPVSDILKLESDIIGIKSCIAYLGKKSLHQEIYYIANTQRIQNHRPVFSLYKKIDKDHSAEFIANIEDMRIFYDVVDKNKIYSHLSLRQVWDWSLVKGVEFNLLLRSSDPVLMQPKVYWFLNQRVIPQDLYMYQPLKIYIAVKSVIVNHVVQSRHCEPRQW